MNTRGSSQDCHTAGHQTVLNVQMNVDSLRSPPLPSAFLPRSTLAPPLRCMPPDSLGKALQPFLEHQHCACALDTVSHFIVIDSELSWSKSPFYIWERDCFKKKNSSQNFTHGSWGDPSVTDVLSEQVWGHGFEPQNMPKIWTESDKSVIPVHLPVRRTEAGDSPKKETFQLSWYPQWQTAKERS